MSEAEAREKGETELEEAGAGYSTPCRKPGAGYSAPCRGGLTPWSAEGTPWSVPGLQGAPGGCRGSRERAARPAEGREEWHLCAGAGGYLRTGQWAGKTPVLEP